MRGSPVSGIVSLYVVEPPCALGGSRWWLPLVLGYDPSLPIGASRPYQAGLRASPAKHAVDLRFDQGERRIQPNEVSVTPESG